MLLGAMRRLVVFCVIATLPISTAATVALGGSYSIRSGSIGSARLGLAGHQYAQVFGARPFTTRYADGTVRLLFEKAEVEVLLSRADSQGFAIFTAAREYRTAAGIGPCSPVRSLLRAYGGKLRRYPAGSQPIVAYKLGRLWFTVYAASRIVGGVMLSERTPTSASLSGAPVCGQSEEGE